VNSRLTHSGPGMTLSSWCDTPQRDTRRGPQPVQRLERVPTRHPAEREDRFSAGALEEGSPHWEEGWGEGEASSGAAEDRWVAGMGVGLRARKKISSGLKSI